MAFEWLAGDAVPTAPILSRMNVSPDEPVTRGKLASGQLSYRQTSVCKA